LLSYLPHPPLSGGDGVKIARLGISSNEISGGSQYSSHPSVPY
jgi:hypothetical protein